VNEKIAPVYNNDNDDADYNNNNQSNLAKGGIVVAILPISSLVVAKWQHRTDGLHVLAGV